MFINSEQIDPGQIFLDRVFYDCLKLIYGYLNEKDNVCESYSCLKIIAKAY